MGENYCLNVALDALFSLYENGKMYFPVEKIVRGSVIICERPNKIIVLYSTHKIKLFNQNGKWTVLGVD